MAFLQRCSPGKRICLRNSPRQLLPLRRATSLSLASKGQWNLRRSWGQLSAKYPQTFHKHVPPESGDFRLTGTAVHASQRLQSEPRTHRRSACWGTGREVSPPFDSTQKRIGSNLRIAVHEGMDESMPSEVSTFPQNRLIKLLH